MDNNIKEKLQEKIIIEYETILNHLLENCFHDKHLDDEVINYIVNDVCFQYTEKDERYLILTSCRKYILQSIELKKVKYESIKHKELRELYGVRLNIFSEEKLLIVLSLLNRKEFTYLINKYYCYCDAVNNDKYDKKIIEYFSGLGDAKGYFYVHGFKRTKIDSKDIYGCILFLPQYFFRQIGESGILLPHPSVNKNNLVVAKINKYNLSFGYKIAVAVIIIIGFIFYLLL